MILINRNLADHYRDESLWGTVTLDGLVKRWALEMPDKEALALDSCSLTWLELDAAINACARRLLSLGLESDDVVAIQLDNSVESPIAILAVFRANMIAAPIPPLWRHHEITGALSQITPKAIITRTQIGAHEHGLMMRDVALEIFTVRQILAFGEDVPDGLMDINDIFDEQHEEISASRGNRASPADHIATMCWWTEADPLPRPVARCHNHWISAAMPTLLEAQVTSDDVILSAQYLTGLGSIATVLGPWLLSGCKLVLHKPFEIEKFAEQCVSQDASLVVLPAPLSEVMSELFSVTNVRSAVCIWPDLNRARMARVDGLGDWSIPVVDVCLLGEAALCVHKRGSDHTLGQMPVGTHGHALPDGGKLDYLETRIKGGIQHASSKAPILGGEILVRGPMVPSEGFGPAKKRAFKAEFTKSHATLTDSALSADEFMATGINCAISGTSPPMIEPVSPEQGIVTVGGMAVSLADLDLCYNTIDNVDDAAAFSVKDNLLGNRIYGAFVPKPGAPLMPTEIQSYLRQHGIASYKIPEKLIEVSSIPRRDDGSPDRERLQDEM